jgi:hypothetical protein
MKNMKETTIIIPEIQNDTDVRKYAAGLQVTIDAAQGESLPKNKDPFWENCEEYLLWLVCLYVCRLPKSERSLASIEHCIEMLATESLDEDLPTIKALKGKPESTQEKCYKNFLLMTDKIRKTACLGELAKLSLLKKESRSE